MIKKMALMMIRMMMIIMTMMMRMMMIIMAVMMRMMMIIMAVMMSEAVEQQIGDPEIRRSCPRPIVDSMRIKRSQFGALFTDH